MAHETGHAAPRAQAPAVGQAVGQAQVVRREPSPRWLQDRYVRRGWSAQRIAEVSGWSSQFIRDRLRAAGIELRPAGSRAAVELSVDRLRELLSQGVSVAQIADRYGRSRSGIYTLMRRHHLTATTRPAAAQADESVGERCVQLYREGCSLAEVGREFGRGPDWARARIVAAGGQVRAGGRIPARVQVEKLRAALEAGASVTELAQQHGRSVWWVHHRLAEAGLPRPAPRRRLGPQLPVLDADLLRELYVDRRLVLAEVAAELGVSVDRVKVGLDAAGITRRPRRPRHLDGPPAAPITAEQLHQLYEERGLSTAQVADQLGATGNRVRAALHTHGMPLRPRPAQRVAALDLDADTLRLLYVDQRLDDDQIAAHYGVPTDRVRRRRRTLGVRRPATPPPHPPRPAAPPAEVLRQLYVDQGVTLTGIARRFHTSQPVVHAWLDEVGIPVRERTSRAHRRQLDLDTVVTLYRDREWPAATVAAHLDTTLDQVLRTLHDHAIPVRPGGTPPNDDQHRTRQGSGERAVALLRDLYADPDVQAWQAHHRIPTRADTGPIAARFPRSVALRKPMLTQAYEQIGLSTRQIELLTGQPEEQVLDALHGFGVWVRGPGAAPWTQRRRSRRS